MNNIYKHLFAVLSVIFAGMLSHVAMAQTTITMPLTGTNNVSNCIVNFYDDGGATGNYSNNVNGTTVFTPATPGTQISTTFSAFSLENNADFLYVYNGNSTAAPLLGAYTGTTLPPTITANNATGSLTFKMVSDAVNTSTGFAATITCLIPCSIDTIAFTTSPAHVQSGTNRVVKSCINQSIFFNGVPSYVLNSDTTNTIYKWEMGDGTIYNTKTVNHAYGATGIYNVVLRVTDTHAICTKVKALKVFVSQVANFTGTGPERDTICQNDTVNFFGIFDFKKVREICAPPIADTTFLPDGSGVSYMTSITADCFGPADVITQASDLARVYVNMEHSYLGDLEMKIICPNGQSSVLKEYPNGGGTFLGGPNDPGPGDNIPGIGWTYEFRQSAAWGTMLQQNGVAGFLVPSPGLTPGSSLPQGAYKPFQNFSSLIGCPLNGSWSLQITDNLASDNGFIFFWGLEFAPNFQSNLDSFKNYAVDSFWNNDPTIIARNGGNMTARIDTFGTKCYTFTVKNDFGCFYDTTVCVFVKQMPFVEIYDSICPWQDMFGYTETGTYVDTFPAMNGCDSLRILHLFKRPIVDSVSLGLDRIVCQYDSVRLEPMVLPYASNYIYEWRRFPGIQPISNEANYLYTAQQTETYVLSVKPPLGCFISDTVQVVVNPGDFLKMYQTDTGICPRSPVQLKADGAQSYHWSPSLNLSNPNIANPIATPTTTTQYQLIGTSDKGCTDTQLVTITVHPDAVITLPDSINVYPGEVYFMEPGGNCVYFQWFPDAGLSSATASNPKVNPEVNTRYFVTARTENGCSVSDSVDVLVKQTVIDMPNAFTPNNSSFKASLRGIAKLNSFQIFNRWGEKVFETTDINKGWDGSFNGKPQAMGSYVYIIDAVTTEGKPFKKTGTITLVR
ncbi:hypothetical protein DBR32_08535 [Taibaiella sp. KBW10]|uniref:T9SS type B sorting domain-containing protein n=1 Tax=Taibaiella sp. KBW10 TaxID=2153357 RepID=UPI000F5ABA19|nr:gliding motility-associated C-terminal domain-containing protein [Taibaiella sp. KBW10]RQO30764.1 hypothetical protein DBR32_08535 [Taibaiella sp. KBW10]